MSGTTSATLFEDLMVDWGEIDYLLTNEIAQRDLILTDLGISAAADDNTAVPSAMMCQWMQSVNESLKTESRYFKELVCHSSKERHRTEDLVKEYNEHLTDELQGLFVTHTASVKHAMEQAGISDMESRIQNLSNKLQEMENAGRRLEDTVAKLSSLPPSGSPSSNFQGDVSKRSAATVPNLPGQFSMPGATGMPLIKWPSEWSAPTVPNFSCQLPMPVAVKESTVKVTPPHAAMSPTPRSPLPLHSPSKVRVTSPRAAMSPIPRGSLSHSPSKAEVTAARSAMSPMPLPRGSLHSPSKVRVNSPRVAMSPPPRGSLTPHSPPRAFTQSPTIYPVPCIHPASVSRMVSASSIAGVSGANLAVALSPHLTSSASPKASLSVPVPRTASFLLPSPEPGASEPFQATADIVPEIEKL